jgi:hypothetical protein
MRDWRKETGGRGVSNTRPLLPPSGGQLKRRHWRGRGTYRPTNSRPATMIGAASLPSLSRALSPASFAFDHPTQSLTAGVAAKLLAGAVTGAYEPLIAPRTLAAKKIEFTRWMLTLAGWHRRRVKRLRGGENRRPSFSGLGFCRLPALGAAASIPLTLGLPLPAPFRVLAIFLAVAFVSPSPSRLAALGAAISSLGMGRAKGFLTSLEQTRSLARPTSPLTCPRFTASWCWAQGSG